MSDAMHSLQYYAEVAFAAPACVICVLFFILLITIPLPNGCKAFLYINTVALFSMAYCQWSIADWKARNKSDIGPQELHFFHLVFLHQAFYLTSTFSLFFLTCERLLLCAHPTFYETHGWCLLRSITMAICLEAPLVFILTLLAQYENTRLLAVFIASLTEMITLLLLLLCYRQSRHYYTTVFRNDRLNARYQVKEVIELTRVLIPIGIISIGLKLAVLVSGVSAFTDPSSVGSAVCIITFVSTTMSYVEPILLMIRHKLFSRRVAMILRFGRYQPHFERIIISTADATRSYFDSLHREWN